MPSYRIETLAVQERIGNLMGDRANVYVKDRNGSGVYLYTHWGGHDLPETVRLALDSEAGRNRWADEPYLARILFCAMVGEDKRGETGFGISAHLNDNEHPIIVVDPAEQRIGFAVEPDEDSDTPVPTPTRWQSFAAYCAKRNAKYPATKT